MSDNSYIEKLKTIFKNSNDLYLIRISIGPVQEFIAEARKVRDLFIGSFLLSKITFESMKPIIDKDSAAIILPNLDHSPWKSNGLKIQKDFFPSLPNLYLAIIKKEDLSNLTKAMKEKITTFVKEITGKVHLKIQGIVQNNFNGWDDLWKSQIDKSINFTWIATPVSLNEIGNKYKDIYSENQLFLEERKLTRTFEQWKGSNVEKCIQCGHREVL